MSKTDLLSMASGLAAAWRSTVVGQAAGTQVKVLRMDATAYPDEAHPFDEALLVLDGVMNLQLRGEAVQVRAGEVYVVPAGVPHAVAPGSHGTLVIIDRGD
ncbi:cupin domain-containing protein [Ideonella sp. DXS29W]|uniref:Cupin domain-containing protein n=1 Tax=Ideonella lacteola TaxID=2984193 RepID=A0ABU9BZQ2_9BURK